MMDRDAHILLHARPELAGGTGASADPTDFEAQWQEAARSLGLEAAMQPMLEPQAKAARAAEVQTLMEAGNHAAAVDLAWALAYDDPWNRDHTLDLALCLQHLGELDSACRFYSVALLLDPTDAYTLYRLGECLDGLGERDDARAVYLATLELAREDAAYSDVGQQALARLDALGDQGA